MNQATLALDTLTPRAADRTGFDIGWDHARHALVPPPSCHHGQHPVHQGWLAGKAVFGRRTLPTRRHTRLWLQLRLASWQRGEAFDDHQITPNLLAQIEATHCPVTRSALGGAAGEPQSAVVVRLNPDAGWTAGNLAMLSEQAAGWLASHTVEQAVRKARQAEATGEPAALWWRLATLRAFTTPLPFAEAARLPLAVLPPNRVRVLNAAQGLQALLTRLFAAPGWAARCRELGALLPEHTLRHDWNLFVGAMAPRVVEAGSDPAALRAALENAWLGERVQRRWQHLLLSLGEAATGVLLDRAAALQMHGVRVMQHARLPALRLVDAGLSAGQGASQGVDRGRSAQPARPGTVQPPAAPAAHA